MKRYLIEWRVYSEIEIDESLLPNDEWRSTFYGDIDTLEKTAEHIGYNMVANDAVLSKLDGFADQPDSKAKLISREWETENIREIGSRDEKHN